MKIVAVIALLVMSLSAKADLPKEMYMANDAGGFVVLTIDLCAFPKVSKEYPYKAYATESSDAVYHAGCWVSPDTSNLPTELYSKSEGAGVPPTISVLRMVNTWWEEGGTASFLQRNFTPEKKRLK